MSDTTKKANFIARTLFIIGGIILFVVLVLFILKLVPIMLSGLSSVFNFGNQNKETITLSTSVEIVPNQNPVIVSFEHEPLQTGSYFVSYTCADGLFFDIQSATGPKRIICDTPFKLGSNISSIALVPVLTKTNSFVDSTIKIEYKDEKNNTVDAGTKVVTVTSDATSAGSATSTPTQSNNPFDINAPLSGSAVTTTPLSTPVPSSPSTPTQSRPVTTTPTRDLTITTIYSVANQSTFVMHVYNYGNTATGPWTFTYTDAENPSRIVTGPTQASLGAGQGMAVTVRFDGQLYNSQIITVIVNPNNQINETNTSNNSASVTITGRTSTGNTTGGYNSNERADLTITSMKVGRLSGNRFLESDSIYTNDRGSIRFVVQNQGGQSTGSWRFEIEDLPYSSNNQTYTSSYQSSLAPGEFRELFIDFDSPREGRYNPEVFIDSHNDVREERENNNKESIRLYVER